MCICVCERERCSRRALCPLFPPLCGGSLETLVFLFVPSLMAAVSTHPKPSMVESSLCCGEFHRPPVRVYVSACFLVLFFREAHIVSRKEVCKFV
jgi:hypothetical protein